MKTLREWRRLKALSARELVKLSGVSLGTVYGIEQGRIDPQPRTVRRICAALGTEPGDVTEFALPLRHREREEKRDDR